MDTLIKNRKMEFCGVFCQLDCEYADICDVTECMVEEIKEARNAYRQSLIRTTMKRWMENERETFRGD